MNLKSPCTAQYLWNVLGHFIKSICCSVFFLLSYLSEGQEGNRAYGDHPSEITGSWGCGQLCRDYPSSTSQAFTPGLPGDPGDHSSGGSFVH